MRHRTEDIRQREGIREKESKVRDSKEREILEKARVCVHACACGCMRHRGRIAYERQEKEGKMQES